MPDYTNQNKIVFTGGHAGITAVATIEAFREKPVRGSWECHWIGARRAFMGKSNLALEFKVLPKMGVVCHPIVAGKIQSKLTRHSVGAVIKIPVGFLHAGIILLKIKPRVVVSFGGYAGVPVVTAAWLLGIPVVIHEQVAAAGLGNRLTAVFAKKIAVARENSMEYFPKRKTVLVGNPILRNIAEIEPKSRLDEPPVLLVTGGSRGSTVINKVIVGALDQILKKYKLIHQTGELDYENIKSVREKLTMKEKRRYLVFGQIDPFKMNRMYRKADVVIGRAGANTVSEVLAAGRPAIYIPIPWSIFNEQEKNARYAQRVGMATIIRQNELNEARLLKEIGRIIKNWKGMARKGFMQKATFDEGAAEKLSAMAVELAQ